MPATSEKALKRKRERARERKRKNTREWKLKNPEKVREQKARYRQRKKVSYGEMNWQQHQVDEENEREYETRHKKRMVLEKKLKESHGVKELRVALVDCQKPNPKKVPPLKEMRVLLTDCRKSTQRVRECENPPPRKRIRREGTNKKRRGP